MNLSGTQTAPSVPTIDRVKFLAHGGVGPYSGHRYSIKEDGTTDWLPEQTAEQCHSGYHYARRANLLSWLEEEAYAVEARGERDFGDKSAAESIRLVRRLPWDETQARLFATDCAECALPLWEAQYRIDLRPRNAIEAARDFARKKITCDQLATARAAAGDARAAAQDAARDAARAAAWAAGAAAWAARAAARAAAEAASRAAAEDAVRAAAIDAAGAAAWAARAAAIDAARDLLAAYLHGDPLAITVAKAKLRHVVSGPKGKKQ